MTTTTLLDQIKTKIPLLNHTQSRVRRETGEVYMEDIKKGLEEVVSVGEAYYVVDNSPDYNLGRVLEGLSMGSQDIAAKLELLEEYAISHVLSLGVQVERFEGICYMYVPVLDLPEFNLRKVLEQCFSFIDSVREEGGHVYVHCNAGISRSASVVIGYLMKEFNISFEEAKMKLKQLRPSIKPNQGFTQQLLSFEKDLLSLPTSIPFSSHYF